MTNESTFPQSRQDLSDLKQTAVDAAKDLGSTAAVHAKKAQGHLQDLASHAQEEGTEQVDHVKSVLADVGTMARDYVTSRPLTCIGTALAVGFLIGLSRRNS